MSRVKQAARKLIPDADPRGGRKLPSPVVGALLVLAILLGKAVVCQQAPGRSVFFDAMLLAPISILAFHDGLVTGLVAGLLATGGDLVISAKLSGLVIPAYLASSSIRTAMVAKLFSLEILAGVVSALTFRARKRAIEAERKIEESIKKVYMLEKHTETMQRDARDQQARFEKNLLKYSSLLYLLEESAEKIYSNLETDRLFQSLFRVLEECFGSTSASVYLKDYSQGDEGSYFLVSASGTEPGSGGDGPAENIPMMLKPDDILVTEVERNRHAIRWDDEHHAGQLGEMDGRPAPIISGTLLDKGELTGIINVHAVDREESPDLRLMGMVCNIASIALANARLFGEVQWLAKRDPLTKLYNRRTFHEHLESQIAGSERQPAAGAAAADRSRNTPPEPFAVLMLDIDHFKAFNDTYGHQAGDAVLQWFASHCEECAGDENAVFRYGGEEFTVIMPGSDAQAGRKMAEKIGARIQNARFRYQGTELKVTLSCGIAVFPNHGAGADELVRKADKAMYRAKKAGRNSVAVSKALPGHDTIIPYEARAAAAAKKPAPGGPSARPAPGTIRLDHLNG